MLVRGATVWLGVLAIVALGSGAWAGPSRCSADKTKAAGKKASSKLTCLAKGVSKGLDPDSTCLAKAEVKFSSTVTKAENKSYLDSGCLTKYDRAAVEAQIDAVLGDIDLLVDDPPSVSVCDSEKVKAAGKKIAAKLTCFSKAVAKAVNADSACLAKAEVKFSSAATKAEMKATSKGLPCSALGDYPTYESIIDAAGDDLARNLGYCASCCGNTILRLTNGNSALNCGHVEDAVGATLGQLSCNGFHLGGGSGVVPLPVPFPDQWQTDFKLNSCAGFPGSSSFESTTAAETGSPRTCSSAGESNGYPRTGCLFGAPLPVPNTGTPATSVCMVNRMTSDGSAISQCAGQTDVYLALGSDLYLTGDLLPGVSGIQTCPTCAPSLVGDACSGPSPCCHGGPNDDLPCTPGTSALSASYPTSHDCPPAEALYIGTLATGPFRFTTFSEHKTANDADGAGGQNEVFCGHCRQSSPPFTFESPATRCTISANCMNPSFPVCQQRSNGAFGFPTAHFFRYDDGAPGCLSGGLPRPAGLSAVFCLPSSNNGLVDSTWDIPGPAAIHLPATFELLP